MGELLIEKDLGKAVSSISDIEFDAFIAFIGKLLDIYPDECRDYLFAIVTNHEDVDVEI